MRPSLAGLSHLSLGVFQTWQRSPTSSSAMAQEGSSIMRNAYRVLAYLVAAGVALQAAAIANAMFGLITWIERGGPSISRRKSRPRSMVTRGFNCMKSTASSSCPRLRCCC